MGKKGYCYLSALIFAGIGVGHLLRAFRGIPVQLGERHIPIGVSWGGAVVALVLCLWGLASARK
ncbi:MAG: hypothetical protein HY509_04785 [Acidobacteria bacterium]|nr:hypothetical protein [Acidobacteriota bacterium]